MQSTENVASHYPDNTPQNTLIHHRDKIFLSSWGYHSVVTFIALFPKHSASRRTYADDTEVASTFCGRAHGIATPASPNQSTTNYKCDFRTKYHCPPRNEIWSAELEVGRFGVVQFEHIQPWKNGRIDSHPSEVSLIGTTISQAVPKAARIWFCSFLERGLSEITGIKTRVFLPISHIPPKISRL